MRAKLGILICVAVFMAGCAVPDQNTPSRGLPVFAALFKKDTGSALGGEVIEQIVLENKYRIQNVTVRVPETLEVSEGNSYYPQADIVWHGDPYGDRHDQVKAVVKAAADRAKSAAKGDTPINLDIEVRRFHALTERTRYTIGGLHEFEFTLLFLDARTGLPLAPPRQVETNIKGFGGLAAVRAEAMGQTQKVRITDYLSQYLLEQTAIGPGA